MGSREKGIGIIAFRTHRDPRYSILHWEKNRRGSKEILLASIQRTGILETLVGVTLKAWALRKGEVGERIFFDQSIIELSDSRRCFPGLIFMN
jgi:hypothetical protein